ncbi:MAG: trans-sulfuration enzyme family protein [Sulfobacillus sp.]
MTDKDLPSVDPATQAVHPPAVEVRQQPLVAPIYGTSVFVFPDLETVDQAFTTPGDFVYSRMENPNTLALGQQVAALEGAEAGIACSSGQAALWLAMEAACAPGQRLWYAHHLYGGTLDLIQTEIATRRPVLAFDPWADSLPSFAAGEGVLVESISNPLCRPSPLGRLAQRCQQSGARLVVDNTFATPVCCRPLDRGADVVVHSLTKAISGHAHVILGAVVGRQELVAEAARLRGRLGMVADARAAWLALEGAKTLFVRQQQAVANASELARHLDAHPAVKATHHPSLGSDQSWKMDLLSPGALLAFDVGSEQRANSLVRGLRLIVLAPSLGDVATTVSHPGLTSHRSLGAAQKAAIGVTEGLIRLSVGIEQVADLWQDLAQALAAVS